MSHVPDDPSTWTEQLKQITDGDVPLLKTKRKLQYWFPLTTSRGTGKTGKVTIAVIIKSVFCSLSILVALQISIMPTQILSLYPGNDANVFRGSSKAENSRSCLDRMQCANKILFLHEQHLGISTVCTFQPQITSGSTGTWSQRTMCNTWSSLIKSHIMLQWHFIWHLSWAIYKGDPPKVLLQHGINEAECNKSVLQEFAS